MMKKDVVKKMIVIILAIILGISILNIIGIGCPILFFTGIPCMGCGITRAFLSLLKGDFISAFRYHPLILLVPFLCFLMFDESKPNKESKWYKVKNIAIYVIVALFIIVYLIRVFIIKDPIVQINIKDGLLYKIYV